MKLNETNANNHCQFAYNSFYYNKGNVSHCCLQTPLFRKTRWDDVANIQDFYYRREFDDVRFELEQGRQPKACETCWANERNGTVSMRQQNMYYKPNEATYIPKIRHVDLRLSNKCNLQCKMCSPSDSDQIARIVGKTYEPTDTETLLDRVYEMTDVEAIRFAGGEPFVMPEVEQFLHRLVQGNKRHINIEIITNVTSVKPRLLETLNEFDRVDIMASIDSVGRWFEFQRYPAQWSQVERNFSKLYNSKCHTRLVPCIGNINLLGVADFFEWANQYPDALVTFNEIFEPEFLNFRFVPMDLRQSMIKRFSSMRLANAVPAWNNFKQKLMYEYVEPSEQLIEQLQDHNRLVWQCTQQQMEEFFPWIYM